jgi:hypothetical protein
MGAVKRKRKLKEANASQETNKVDELDSKNDVSFAEQPRKLQKVASSWLENFLAQKRDLIVPTPPDCELADDTYLREFSKQFTRSAADDDENPSSDDEDNPYSTLESVEIAIVSREEMDTADNGEDEEELVKTNGKIRLLNLPYKITEKNVSTYMFYVAYKNEL